MKILLSNDDGFLAPGILALKKALSEIADITMVAPDRNRSGVSNALTLDAPLQATLHEPCVYSVNGTPTDCVHLAVTGLLDQEPDMVVSGINQGGNLSDDVIYSGTVAAATEGRFLGFPAIAVSLIGHDCQHYDAASQVVRCFVAFLMNNPLPADSLLNINIPDLPLEKIQGVQLTRLGRRHKSQPVIKQKDPRGNTVYWVGPPGEAQDAGPGTDFHAVKHGFVSITPLQLDLTHYQAVSSLSGWMEDFAKDLLTKGPN